MNSLATPPVPPHFHEHTRLSPSRSMMTPSGARKRKASPSPAPEDDPMTTSPAISNARLPHALHPSSRKRVRSNLAGRPLSVDRLLETLDTDSLRSVLRTLLDRNPALKEDVVHISPRPSTQSTLQVLRQYHDRLMAAFPLGPNPRSDYAYDRVRSQWQDLLNALTDFTPQFLPPNESQSSTSLSYLDDVTNIIHDLPQWDNPQYNLAKQNAYEEIARAWTAVIREAGKRGGGIQLQYGGWEEKLRGHVERSNGVMREAYQELVEALGWLRSGSAAAAVMGQGPGGSQSIRQQLLSGTYGVEQQRVRTGLW